MFAIPILAVIFIVALTAIGVGLFLAAIVAGCVVMLVSAGIVSSSVIVGFKTGSPSTGIQLALFQIGAALGAAAGLGIAAAIKFFGQIHLGWMPIEGLGFSAGVCSGMVVAGSFGVTFKYTLRKWGRQEGFEVLQNATDYADRTDAGNRSPTATLKPGNTSPPDN